MRSVSASASIDPPSEAGIIPVNGIDKPGNPIAPLTQLIPQLADRCIVWSVAGLADGGECCIGCGLDLHNFHLEHGRYVVVHSQCLAHRTLLAPHIRNTAQRRSSRKIQQGFLLLRLRRKPDLLSHSSLPTAHRSWVAKLP
jgi:hypothetical protein